MDISAVENLVIGFLKRLQPHEGAPLLGLVAVDSRIRILKALWDCHEPPANSRIPYRPDEPWGHQVAPQILEHCRESLKVATIDAIRNPDLAHELRSRVRLFANFVDIDHRDAQRILGRVDHKVLALALVNADDGFRDAVLKNLSGFNRDVVVDEIGYLDEVDSEDVDAARDQVVMLWREFDESSPESPS